MTGEGCECVAEGGRGHSHPAPATTAAAAKRGGGPDDPRPMRPHPSATHADQRRARRDGCARPRSSSIASGYATAPGPAHSHPWR